MLQCFATVGSFGHNLQAFTFKQRLDPLANQGVIVG
jgi:hypothetical protein